MGCQYILIAQKLQVKNSGSARLQIGKFIYETDIWCLNYISFLFPLCWFQSSLDITTNTSMNDLM